LEVDIEGFDLSRLSPCLPGYNVERGSVAQQSSAKVVAGELDIQNNLTIDRLTWRTGITTTFCVSTLPTQQSRLASRQDT
jgi:hypothetical protein